MKSSVPFPTKEEQEQLLSEVEAEEAMVRNLLGSHALAKACMDDPFDYALRLRTGEVIAFSGCTVLNDEWVRIQVKPMDDQPAQWPLRVAYPADRGMDVRIADIVWVMDAPNGS